MSFPNYRQLNAMDCGPTCLRIIAKYYGKNYTNETLRNLLGVGKGGTTLLGISEGAEKMGFRTRGVMQSYEQLRKSHLPCVLHWNQKHFVVLASFDKKGGVKVSDPGKGIIRYSKKEFLNEWISTVGSDNIERGAVLLLAPTEKFLNQEDEIETKLDWSILFKYLRFSKVQISQILAALLITSFLQLLVPFLTQTIVDVGINLHDLNYISLILIAQLTLVFSRTLVDFIRTRILLRVSSSVNLSLLSDFWIKLTYLPLSYFELHRTGDTIQRINDHKKIQEFLTGSSLNTIFSVISLTALSVILFAYNGILFLIFCIGTVSYLAWVSIFLKIRRKLNYKLFDLNAKESDSTLELIQGMKEIRLTNSQQIKRWDWEDIQSKIFQLNLKILRYNQFQQTGATLITQGKDVVITFITASLVINGDLTLGAMLAIQYIVGQLSNPVEQIITFMQTSQDAKISFERLNEVHSLDNEEKKDVQYRTALPNNKTITFNNFNFSYPTSNHEVVLKNLNFEITEGKVTAIVGTSGSGKTTILKLLLKFYDTYSGEIKIGSDNFKYINPSTWRNQCGSVLQDGYIFNDTIAKNIAIGEEFIDFDKLNECCKVANILSFIESLPNGFFSALGLNGVGISQGQKQRILIARALYKSPAYLFFDEATNALDSNNEKEIVENLREVFKGRTVVVVAHRLSTVKNADQIIVLKDGSIIEQGTHLSLIEEKGHYFELVKNQLELQTVLNYSI